MPDRTIAPPIKDPIHFDIRLSPCTQISLANGVPLYYINDGAEEVTMLELVFKAGNNFENKNGIAGAANQLIKNGTSKRTSYQITDYFEYYGAFLNRSSHHETASITLHCLSKYLKIVLPVVREILTEAIFPEEEVDIFRKNNIQRLVVNLHKSDFVANRLIDQYLFGANHPYGRVSHEQDIEAIDRADLITFFNEYYKSGNCRIFSAGKLPSDFEEIMNQNFGDLPLFTPVPSLEFAPKPEEQKKHRVVNDENGAQGAIRIARTFPGRKDPDFKKAMVLNTLFGGYFGSRLMNNIREEKGYTYGISSYLQNHLDRSAWMISTEAGKDVSEATVTEVYKEMEDLRNEPADDEELLLVKNYMMGINLSYIDGPFNTMNRWKSLIINGLDEDYFNETIETIRDVKAEELQELANKYLQPDAFYELIVV